MNIKSTLGKNFVDRYALLPVAIFSALSLAGIGHAQTADPPPYALIANPLPDTMDHQRRDSVNLKFSRIRLNQAGYRPQDEKLFYYVGSAASSFSVINLATGASAGTGTLTSTGSTTAGQLKMSCYYKAMLVSNGAIKYTMQSPSMSGTVYKGLIPDLPEGRYKITIGSDESAPFVINANVYGMVKDALLKFYGVNRCGPNDSWFHPGCHLKDAVTGGWHDAGDHMKIAQTIGYTFAVVGLSAAALKDRDADHYSKNQSKTLITDGIPDVLVEAKVGADYMVNSYRVAGSSAGKMITDIGENGADHGWWGRPEFQDAQIPARGGPPRPTYVGLGGNTCGSLSAGLAFVGRLYAPYDAAYAAQCIKIAKELYAYGKANPTDWHNPMYSGGGVSNDEMAFGALALWWATKDNLYKNDLLYDKTIGSHAALATYPKGGFAGGWFCAKQPGMLKDFANSDYDNMHTFPLWGLYRLILTNDSTAAVYGISASERLALTESVIYCLIANMCDVSNQNGDQSITVPQSSFQWKQNTLKCSSLWGWMNIQQDWMVNRYQATNITDVFCYYDIASKIQGTELPNSPATTDWKVKEIKSLLVKQLDYMLGMNPWDVSMIVGVGYKNLNHPHHRAATPELQNVPGTFYKYLPPVGALSGGYYPTVPLYNEYMGGSDGYFHAEVSIDATTSIFLPVMGLAKEDTLSAPTATVRTVYVGCDKAIIEIRQSRYGTSTINYGTTAVNLDKSKASDSAAVFQTITLTGLTAGTTYYFNVKVKDMFGKDSIMLDLDPDKVPVPFSFTTPQTCPTNAQISNVKVCSVTNDSAEIFWFTPNDAFDSKVVYGTTKPPTIVHDGDNSGHPAKFHFVTIDGLKEQTTYWFYVQSGASIDDNKGQYYTFTTPVKHVNFDLRAIKYTWDAKDVWGINLVNQEPTQYDSLEVRLYFRAKESENFPADLAARIDIIFMYNSAGFQLTVPTQDDIRAAIQKQKPIKMSDTYDPKDSTFAYYLAAPLTGAIMNPGSRIRFDVVMDRRSRNAPYQDIMNAPPDHIVTARDWSYGPHTDPIYFPGIPTMTKEDVDNNYFTAPIDYYMTVYRKGEFVWGYSPSDSEQTTKINHYELKTQITSPLTNPTQDYVFFERTVNTVNVSGWATVMPIDGTINDLMVNDARLDPMLYVKWNQSLGRYDFTVPVPVKNGKNSVDITLFAGPSATCDKCYGCVASNHHFFIEFRGAKQYPSSLLLKNITNDTIASGDTVHIDTTMFNIIVTDRNGNLNGKSRDTLFVSIVNPGTGDSTAVMLVETGDSTSQFGTIAPLAVVSEKKGDNQILMNPGDMLYITYTDPSDPTDVSSANVVTKADFPIAQRGWLLDKNGDGRADSAVVIYNRRSMTAGPDSLRFYFPDTGSVQIIKQGQGAISFSDNAVRAAFALPFASNITAFYPTNKGSGISYFSVQSIVKKNTFPVFDSIGPVITSATAIERLENGVDTIYVSFSEPIQSRTLVGASLILIKNGVPNTIVVDTFKQVSGGMFVVALSTSSAAPKAGDSLRINFEGPLRDQLGNRAHPLNRPVPLATREIAPSLVSAYYLDRDSGIADGVVDIATIKFDKKVKLDGLSLVFDWGVNFPKVTVQSAAIAIVPGDSTAVTVNLKGLFSSKPLIKTSGNMNVMSQWKEFPGQPDNIRLQDSAGPVISTASYLLSGEIGSDCDTLLVFFSEPVSMAPQATPFKFLKRGDSASYMVTVSLLKELSNDTMARFCADANPTVGAPRSGDSIWINPSGGIFDVLGVVQGNERNRRVALKVNQPNSELMVQIMRNPFDPRTPIPIPNMGVQGTAIRISTINPKAKLQTMTGSIKIFDLLGNLVYEDNVIKLGNGSPSYYYFAWEGRNRANRFVGAGTYLVELKYIAEGQAQKGEWLRIGVRY
jgi:hypothetical protein